MPIRLIASSRILLTMLLLPFLTTAQMDRELLFSAPAGNFTESAPLGNGRLGAMVFGNPVSERIVLNEISMWSGGVQDGNRPDAWKYLKPIQQLLLEGKNAEAQSILQKNFICAGPGTGNGQGGKVKYGCYQTLGDCSITWKDTATTYGSYIRTLRLDSATSITTWQKNGVIFRQEVLVSAPANAIVIRLTASRKGSLEFTAALSRREHASISVTANSMLMTGTLDGGNGEKGISYAANLLMVPLDGSITKNGGPASNSGSVAKTGKGSVTGSSSGLTLSNATECLLIITAGTDMNWPDVEQRGPAPAPKVLQQAHNAGAQTWKKILHDHVADYTSYFNRCGIYLDDHAGSTEKPLTSITAPPSAGTAASPLTGATAKPSAPVTAKLPASTSEKSLAGPAAPPLADRLQNIQQGQDDASLVPLYFNFGRYLLISSSRGSLPANLQGLWAQEYQTPWNGDYHTNINIQMNYWQTDMAGLPDLATPVFRLLEQMAHYGQATAKAYYHANGWVTHSITNPWGFTAPGEGAEWGSSLTGGAWLATHVLQRYDYYPDKEFLRRYYPVLKGAAQFFSGILIREPKHQWLVTAPSNSPENSFRLPDGKAGSTCMGPAMDMQIGRQLLLGAAKAARTLNIDRNWADSIEQTARQLAPDQISARTGALQEWLEDYEEVDPHHRHVSPLYGLHPYDEITPWTTPELANAAKTTLIRRGDEGTGWSRAWKMAFWARLGDGNHAYKMLKALWTPAGANLAGYEFSDAGTYPNLFDACPPFQIDGNFGATAAIMELFLQCHGKDQVIRLLPALPDAAIFQNGHTKGLHARGGFSLDFAWQQRKLTTLTVHSQYGQICRIAAQQPARVSNGKGKEVAVTYNNGILSFPTVAGEVYSIAGGAYSVTLHP